MSARATSAASDGRPGRARRSSSRRDDILARAAELFAQRGYRPTTLTELADAIGIAKATLFHHFRTKEQILFELYAQAMDLALARIAVVDDPGQDPADVVREMVREHTLVILQNRALFTIFFDEESGLEPEHLAKLKGQQRDYINMISHRVSELVDKGRVRRGLHPRVAVQALLGAGSWTYRWVEPGRGLTDEQIADEIANLALDGLLTRPS